MDFHVTGTELADDAVLLANLGLMEQLSAGGRWRVDATGRLCRSSWLREDCGAVRRAVASVWQSLAQLDYNGEWGDERRTALAQLTASMRGVSRRYFDRAVYADVLEEALDDELSAKKQLYLELRDAKAEHSGDEQWLRDYREARYDYKVATVRFAQERLGVEFEAVAQGANGTYYGLDKRGRKVVVFKPGNEEQGTGHSPKLLTRVKEFFKRFLRLFMELPANPICGKAYKVEVIASEVDDLLGLGIVPTTRVESFSSASLRGGAGQPAEGSCQLYKKNGYTLEGRFRLYSHLPEFALRIIAFWQRRFGGLGRLALTDEQVQKLDLLDTIMTNPDRHPGNVLITAKRDAQGVERLRPWAIDNGAGAPAQHPSGWLMRRHYGLALRLLPQGRHPYGAAAQALWGRVAQQRQHIVDCFEGHLQEAFDQPVKVVGGQDVSTIRQVLQERLDVIERCLGTAPLPTPYANSLLQSAGQVQGVLAMAAG